MNGNESQLIEQAKRGNNKAFALLYERNVSALYRFLKQFVNKHDSDDIEDWVQRAFVKAFTKIESFEGKSRFSTWLFRLAVNEMRSDMRKIPLLPLESVADENYEQEDIYADDFIWEMTMKELLDEVSAIKKSVFILYEVEGYSHTEIAQILGIEESTSRSILTRTKHYLRKRWISIKENSI